MSSKRFHCEGWWEQEGYGRQAMQPLTLAFVEGRIEGSGSDIVGPFHIQGRIDGLAVMIRKRYVGRHEVIYTGEQDGEGTLSGSWQILGVRGGRWLIRLAREASAPEAWDADKVPQWRPPQAPN